MHGHVNSEGESPASNSVNPTTDAVPPGAPTGLKVELTPTTAVLKWAAATEGGEVEEYEVSVAEGSTPGTTWIPTGSTGTRFFVKRLKRGTQYTFGVRGRNSEGAGDASNPVTQNTPIASLHNALFFKECVNYFDRGARVSVHGNPSELVRAVADNNYKTFTREKDLVINIAVGGHPTRVDAIFVKAKGVTRHSGTPSGGNGDGMDECKPAVHREKLGRHRREHDCSWIPASFIVAGPAFHGDLGACAVLKERTSRYMKYYSLNSGLK